MVHVVDPLYVKEKRFSYTLGLRSLVRERGIYRSQEVDQELLDARFGGTLTIPEQVGVYANRENVRDNDYFGRFDPITWIEDMMAGLNTSEFELFHPTIETTISKFYRLNGAAIIENNYLKINVDKMSTPSDAERGLYVKVQGNALANWSGAAQSPRIYKVREVDDATWWLVPGRLPWSTDNIRIMAADTLRFRLTNPNDIAEYLDNESRGPYSMQYIEAR